jgi:hypothetical protein
MTRSATVHTAGDDTKRCADAPESISGGHLVAMAASVPVGWAPIAELIGKPELPWVAHRRRDLTLRSPRLHFSNAERRRNGSGHLVSPDQGISAHRRP